MNAALLINLLGFSVGVALYVLLGIMVVQHRPGKRGGGLEFLLLTTAFLGTLWNAGELYSFLSGDLDAQTTTPLLTCIAFSALGFLPSVVVHSAQEDENDVQWITYVAYLLSAAAAAIHIWSYLTGRSVPSSLALQTLTFGSIALVFALLIFKLREGIEKKAVWASALLIFAVSALHLSREAESYWYVELIAHQSSLPLALVILFQNYRFAFADQFLKRAISLLMLSAVAFALYVFAAVPLLRYHETHDRNDVAAAALMIGLWIVTALTYPWINRLAVWIVDKVILHREDYDKMYSEIAVMIDPLGSVDAILDAIAAKLAEFLTARNVNWQPVETQSPDLTSLATPVEGRVVIDIPATEIPHYQIVLSDLVGGRRVLSDEISLLQSVAVLTARRIDLVRVSQERFERKFREQEITKLAAEAQLTALRAQINPHFLFNALSTVGYLIKTSPTDAYETLLRLTKLLRGVLRNVAKYTSLGEEARLVENYLDIEKVRFEDKLSVEIAIPKDLESLNIPPLIVQPLVENAIKHGISDNENGGKVRITAQRVRGGNKDVLKVEIWDSGAGSRVSSAGGIEGVGIRNIRERLEKYYGSGASLDLDFGTSGTTASLSIPITS